MPYSCGYVLVWVKDREQADAAVDKILALAEENELCPVRADVVTGVCDIVVPVTAKNKPRLQSARSAIAALEEVSAAVLLMVGRHKPDPGAWTCPNWPGVLGDNPWG